MIIMLFGFDLLFFSGTKCCRLMSIDGWEFDLFEDIKIEWDGGMAGGLLRL